MKEHLKQLAAEGRWEELAELLEEYKTHIKFNKLEMFKPYDYQVRFMNASAKCKQRLMRAANQSGKSFGASFEVAQHITGLYQPYFEGERIEGGGHLYWCIGIDLDSTARVMQRALFGTADIRIEEDIGTGAIPRDTIDFSSFVKDGPRLMSCRIRHVDGSYNTIQFFGAAQGADRLMGAVVKFVWIDEEPKHNSMAVYSQCLTRTTTTNGHIMMTATPEMGFTALQRMFAEDTTGQLYVDSASWWDCPHITENDIKRLMAGIPEWQRDMRSKGLPVLGSGAVFPYTDEVVMCEDLIPKGHWPVICSLDFSSVNDASVVCFSAFDPEEEVFYVYDMVYIDKLEEKNPRHMAQIILESRTPFIPTVSPHDGGVNSVNPEAKAKVMKGMGVNVLGKSFYNPATLSLAFHKSGGIEREPGLTEMRRLMEEGKLKICRSVTHFFREKAQLFYAPASNGGIKCVGQDDAIDAIRYGVISLRGNRGVPFGQCVSDCDNFNNGFGNNEDNAQDWAY